MELIYLYIRKYGELFKNEEFNFSPNYHITLKNNKLILEKEENIYSGYYGGNVKNITMFFGKNGSGKTTLLDILGLSRNDRMDDTFRRNFGNKKSKNYSYFIMYHLVDNYFAFEFVDKDFLDGPNKIINLDLMKDDSESIIYKNAMGTIFCLNGDKFDYCKNILQQELPSYNINEKNVYAYITPGYHNSRLRTDLFNEDVYMFSRQYYFNLNHYTYLYKYLVNIMKVTSNDFLESKLIIESKAIINTNLDFEDYQLDEINRCQKELEQNLKINEELENKRDNFIINFCKKLIVFYFVGQYYESLENSKKYNVEVLTDSKSFEEKQKEEIAIRRKTIIEFRNKFDKLMAKIQKIDVNDINSLQNILENIMNHIKKIAKLLYLEVCDEELIFEILNILKQVPSKYFEKNKIIVDLKEEINGTILKFLSCFDKYYDISHREYKYNCVEKIINISFPKLSEGYEAFLDIIAKSCDAYDQILENDNLILILDEPDRTLHPELARRFLFELLQALNNYKTKGTVQIVMSSHSPFIVTDILPNNVYLLDKQGDLQTKIKKVKNTFATNIYYLLMDSFMMDNTFGEYSYRKIEEIIKELKGSNLIEKERLRNIKHIIDSINEEVIKRHLFNIYDEYCFKYDINKSDKDILINKIKNLDDKDKLKQVMRILEENDKNNN